MVHVKDLEGNFLLVEKDDERIKSGFFSFVWKGKRHTESSKKKMSDSAKNRKISEDNEKIRREGISKKLKGIPKPEGFSDKMRLERMGSDNPYSKYLRERGINSPNKGRKYEREQCPHCKRMISKTVIHVAHLENCKMKNE